MNEKFADIAVPALADTEELLLAPGGVLPRDKAPAMRPVASLLELAPAADGRQKPWLSPNIPIPEIVMSRRATSSRSAIAAISLVTSLIRCSNRRRSANRSVSSLRIAGERSFDTLVEDL